MNCPKCPKCGHETHESKLLGCFKCEVCGWHGDALMLSVGTNTVALSLADYQAIKTACEASKAALESFIELSGSDYFCSDCIAGKGPGCRECSVTLLEREAVSALSKLRAVIG